MQRLQAARYPGAAAVVGGLDRNRLVVRTSAEVHLHTGPVMMLRVRTWRHALSRDPLLVLLLLDELTAI